MYYMVLVLVWFSGVTCGVLLAMVLRVYFLRSGGVVPSAGPEWSGWAENAEFIFPRPIKVDRYQCAYCLGDRKR